MNATLWILDDGSVTCMEHAPGSFRTKLENDLATADDYADFKKETGMVLDCESCRHIAKAAL